jgi:mannosyltransferase OCH1-like enzyme
MADIPKNIWIYWHQGEDAAPDIVKRCIASWRDRNPEWNVRVLDNSMVSPVTRDERFRFEHWPGLTLQHFSDLVRLKLLSMHGGVWADASMYCSTPLDDWLPEISTSGFFAYRGIRRGRIIGNPFLVSQAGHYIPERLMEQLIEHFSMTRYIGKAGKPGSVVHAVLKPVLEISPSTTRCWLGRPFTVPLGIYPYFVFHYMFAKLVSDDAEFRRLWLETPERSPADMMRIKHERKCGSVSAQLREFVASGKQPIHKFIWQADLSSPYWGEVMEILEARHSTADAT